MDGVSKKEAGGIRKAGNQKLTPRQIDAWLARHRAGRESAHAKLSDGDGMYLTVTKAGTPVWRVKYRHGGIESTYSIGPYGKDAPAITLAAARAEREQVRAHLREGRNPLQARDIRRAATTEAGTNTFEAVARDWLRKRQKQWSEVHFEKSERAIERDVLPHMGSFPISEIRPAMVSHVVEEIAARGATETARKVLQHISGIFRLAQARDLCRDNPALPVGEVLPRQAQQTRRPALLKWSELGDILRSAEAARLSPPVRAAHRLCAFVGGCARIGNVVEAEWKEFDLESDPPMWVIPRVKMKAKDRLHDHKVILGPTIAAELRKWRSLGLSKKFVFPSPAGGNHITRESIEKAYRVTLGLGDRHSPHGWRSAFSTNAREKETDRDGAGFERDVVELALDHIHDNDVVRAYDRGERLQQRVRLMNWWDAQLARHERGADIVRITAKIAEPS